jgi:hypothetical protein
MLHFSNNNNKKKTKMLLPWEKMQSRGVCSFKKGGKILILNKPIGKGLTKTSGILSKNRWCEPSKILGEHFRQRLAVPEIMRWGHA